jgi:hypothetical protein
MATTVTVTPITDAIIGSVVTPLPTVDADVLGGFQTTGFIEVEKTLSFFNSFGLNRTLFLEKKLPFQTTVIELPGGPVSCEFNFLPALEKDCQPFTLNGVFKVNGVGTPGILITFVVTPTGSATVSPTSVTTGAGSTFSTTVTPLVPNQPSLIDVTPNIFPCSGAFQFVCTP